MTRVSNYIVALLIMVFGFGMVGVLNASTAVAGDAAATKCTSNFLGFPAWYDGVIDQSTCELKVPEVNENGGGLPAFIFRIVLNVIEIALRLVAFAAAGFIIYGGFKYLTSAGSADRVTAGRKIILNAVIGLVISFMSVAVVNLVAGNISAPPAADCQASAANDTTINPDCVGIARTNANTAIEGILTTVYFAAGIIAVIVIIISSVFYVISQGDPSKTKRAKDGILYSVVGLVIIMMAFVITNFVIGRF